jgi:FtsP/CotA-like multicopper oxidase with cupredoxin domain
MLSYYAIWLYFTAAALARTTHFKIELTWGKGAPDGHERDMIFINGQYPGPLLELQQGDWVEMEVCNQMPFNTTIHTHGILPSIPT